LSCWVATFADSRIAGTIAAISQRARSSAMQTSASPRITNGQGSASSAMPLIDGLSGGRATPVKVSSARPSSSRPPGTTNAASQTAKAAAALAAARPSRTSGRRAIPRG
jgi:hypothetical protein